MGGVRRILGQARSPRREGIVAVIMQAGSGVYDYERVWQWSDNLDYVEYGFMSALTLCHSFINYRD